MHFRSNLNISEFYIVDLIKEKSIFDMKNIQKQFNVYLLKISYLGNNYISFNYFTHIEIHNFTKILQSNGEISDKEVIKITPHK